MEKGTLGYIDALKKRYRLYSLVLAGVITAGVFTVGILFGTFRHLCRCCRRQGSLLFC